MSKLNKTLFITEHRSSISGDFCLLGEEKLSNKTPNCGAGAGSWHATSTIVWPTDLKCHTSNHVEKSAVLLAVLPLGTKFLHFIVWSLLKQRSNLIGRFLHQLGAREYRNTSSTHSGHPPLIEKAVRPRESGLATSEQYYLTSQHIELISLVMKLWISTKMTCQSAH